MDPSCSTTLVTLQKLKFDSQIGLDFVLNQKFKDENNYLKIFNFLFQDIFCQLLNIECPTEEQHEAMDLNGDGNLTWSENLEANLVMFVQGSRGLAEAFDF